MKEDKKDKLKRLALEKAATKILKADERFAKLKELANKKRDIYNKLSSKNGSTQ